jgi:hypothetical protein
MACFVYSEAKDIPIDFWNYMNFSETPGIFEYLSFNDTDLNIKNKRVGNGFFVKINDNIFVITCFHIIQENNVKSVIYYYDDNNRLKNQDAKIKIIIEEFDIALLEIEYPKLIPDSIVHKEHELIHKLSMINLKIDNNAYIDTILSDNLIDYNRIKIHIDIKYVEEKKIISPVLPNHEIPCIDTIIMRRTDSFDINGMSGSLVYNNSQPIGMVIMASDKNINGIVILPITLIIFLVQNSLLKKKQLTTLIFKSQDCEIELDDSVKYENTYLKQSFQNELYYGYIIDDNYDISYNMIGEKTQTKKFKFIQGDIILKINDKYINRNGKVFCDILGYDVKFSTYCLIHGYKNDIIEISYLRNDTILCCNIKTTNLCDILPYHINKNPNFIHYDGLIFVELSDKLLEFFKEKKITLYGEINTIKCDKIQKYVALVHINYEYLKKEYKKGVDELKKRNFPYINNKIFILNKVGNEIVSSLISLKAILMKKKYEKQKTYNYNIMNLDEKNVSVITLDSGKSFSHLKFLC